MTISQQQILRLAMRYTVKSGLTGSGLTGFSGSTGQDARSLQISYPLQWEDSGLTGFRFNRVFRFIRSKIFVPSDRFHCFSSGLTGFLSF